MSVNMLPEYNTILFSDVYDNVDDFIDGYTDPESGLTIMGYKTNPFYQDANHPVNDTSARRTFFLLYSRYGNNPIANRDINQFTLKLFDIVFQYGPTWEKKLGIQKTLRELTEADMLKGSKAMYNHAFNPSTAPSNNTEDALTFINDQNTSSITRPKMEAYGELWSLLDDDITRDYIDKFKKLFKQFVDPEMTLLYTTEVDDG